MVCSIGMLPAVCWHRTRYTVGVFEWMAQNSQQSLQIDVVQGLLNRYYLIPECQTHPEDQIRTCIMVLLIEEFETNVRYRMSQVQVVCTGYI